MDAVVAVIGTTITAALIGISAMFGSTAAASNAPVHETETVTIVLCGQGGLVPPNADGTPAKKCDK